MKYKEIYSRSISNPQEFWIKQADTLDWFKKPSKALTQDNTEYQWFEDGELNTCYLALDSQVKNGRGEQNALIYDSPVTDTISHYTYAELLDLTSRFAGDLSDKGITKGDTVIIYMPMIPEAVIAMLACARLGAVHSVVFGGFAAHELAIRIDDAKPKAIVTANFGVEVNKKVHYLGLVEKALQQAKHRVDTIVIKYRDQDYSEELEGSFDMDECIQNGSPIAAVSVKSNDPLYILYTSGTTGVPKGILRDNGGHATALKYSMNLVYDAKPGEVYWAASDIGWVVGHSYIVYAPLIQGCTTILYEGKPVRTPDAGAFWRVIEQHKVNTLFTAPTAIRAIRKEDNEASQLRQYDISSLKTLYLAGERCDPPTLEWIGEKLKRPVIDHWWQTETGWPIVANPMGVEPHPVKAGSSGLPVCGYDVQILSEEGEVLPANTEGIIAIKLPLPPGCLQTLWQDKKRFVSSYLEEYPGYYKSGDGGYMDKDGYVFIMGRIDDVINVAGHRLSTGEMEEIISAHAQVAECAVFGIDDPIKGQVPAGIVVLKDGETITEDELRTDIVARVRDQIGPIACLKEIRIAKRLPKTRSGKIVRKIISAIRDQKEYKVPSTIDDKSVLAEVESLYHNNQNN
jgi:propionyl-CoA synthetase